ncbi:MAG TPA: ADOP family duplicated permease [Candidatus Acidoferrales bacterium]|nr:ADOP family duplicated permease [Candidatus Acidoferrales bacterium]
MFGKLFGRKRNDRDFKTEVEAHIQMEAERLRELGFSEQEAHDAACRAFGNVTKTQERFYERGRWLFWDNLLRDLRLSLRTLRNSPSFAIAAVVTLAVAIGANTVAFAAFNAFFLRPINVPDPQSLYVVERQDGWGYQSYPNYLDLRDRNRSFQGLAGANVDQVGLDTGQNPSREFFDETSGNYFDVLGLQPYLGRFYHASDERGPNSAPFIVLTHAFWQSHFQADPGAVGRTVRLNKHPYTIIGVAPPGFTGTLMFFSDTFYVPIVNAEELSGIHLNDRASLWMGEVIGHLKPGVTPAQAIADLNSIGSWQKKTYPKDEDVNQTTFRLGRPNIGGDVFGNPILGFLSALMLLAGLILLAACANLGSLFAAHAADRSREVALRMALGSSRTRILRQLFTEAILISLFGGAVGLWGGSLLLHSLGAWRPFPEFPLNLVLDPDAKVYLVALLLSLASGALFGAVPVRQVLQTNPYSVIKSGSAAVVRRRITARDLLLAAQIAICAVLITSSFVAVRGLQRSLHANFGFEPRGVMLVNTDLNSAGYTDTSSPVMQKRMLEAVEAIPGVDSAGMVGQNPPLHMGWDYTDVFTDQTADLRPSNAAASTILYRVSPGYFSAAGTIFLSGRTLTWQDGKNAPRVAVVNLYFAQKVFGSASGALGQYFKRHDGARVQVVGVVENGKYTANLTEDQRAAMFLSILQSPSMETWILVRSHEDPRLLTASLRSRLRDLDSGLPAFIQSWNADMNGALFASRMAAMSLGVLGFLGALLSVTGIFGMAAYAVSKRKRELGIRIALGAQRKELLQAALGHAVKLLAFGSVVGLLLGILAARVLASIVYEATPRDPLVLAGVVLAMALVGLLATWIPAHRALSIDPAMLLREE